MTTKLYVGNLNYDITSEELKKIFESYGKILSAKVIENPETGRSRGYGFVEYSSKEEAQKATQELNGRSVEGRTLTVNEALPQSLK